MRNSLLTFFALCFLAIVLSVGGAHRALAIGSIADISAGDSPTPTVAPTDTPAPTDDSVPTDTPAPTVAPTLADTGSNISWVLISASAGIILLSIVQLRRRS